MNARRAPATARRWAAWLVQWAALAALYDLAIHLALRPTGWIAGFSGALVGAASLRLAAGAFADAARAAEDGKALARSLAGAPPQDGKRFAAAGRIAALASPLSAPLSGVPCVAYRYRIGGAEDGGGDAAPAFAGLALAPAAIATGGPAGEVRLLGFPRLEGFPETPLEGDARARAAAYAAAASFTEIGAEDLAAAMSEPLSLAADAEHPLRRDWHVAGRRELAPDDLSGRLAEVAVPEGAQVCALGLFHAAEGGVAPDPSPQGRPLRLIHLVQGDAAALAREGRGRIALGLGVLAAGHALLAALLFFSP